MRSRLFTVLTATALSVTMMMAQGPKQGSGPGNGTHVGAGLNMAAQTTVEGAITSIQLAYGAQYPYVVVNKSNIKIAPAWFLLDNGMELAAGDKVSILAAPSNTTTDTYLYAIRITKSSTGQTVTLRDSAGVPLWTGNHGSGQGTQPGDCDGCIDLATVKTVTGTVDRVNAGLGIQFPTLVLKLDGGALLTVKIGPERTLLAADFEVTPGSKLTVKYAASTCEDEFVAFSLTNERGVTVTLRNDDGTPVRR